MTRVDAYKKLFEKKDQGVDVTQCLELMATSSSNEVPDKVLEFLGYLTPKSDAFKEFAELLRTKCNNKKSKLYKELLDEDASIDDKVKSLSSYITNVLIACEKLDQSESQVDLWTTSEVARVAHSLSEYFTTANSEIINEVIDSIRTKLLACKSIEGDE